MKVLALVIMSAALFMFSANGNSMCKYSRDFFGTFDTLVTVTGYAKNLETFDKFSNAVQKRFEDLSALYDIYKISPGQNSLKTVNDCAGIRPVKVRREIIDVLELGREYYYKTGGAVNIALGPVLSIWHDCRDRYSDSPESARLPTPIELRRAGGLCNIEDMIIDKTASSVYLRRAGMKLDPGTVAKGYAAQLVSEECAGYGVDSFVINAGGNAVCRGTPPGRDCWSVGIQNPDGFPLLPDDKPLRVLNIKSGSVVTSGDYQRYYYVGGDRYCHIIDPETLIPANRFRAVTVIARDSGIADLLSTALFIKPEHMGLELLETCGASAVWIFADGSVKASPGAERLIEHQISE